MNAPIGINRIVGQHTVREHLTNILKTGRNHHAYLFTGYQGVGKKAIALAFAEALQGVEHLSQPVSEARSAKPDWLSHPDIHVFLPRPNQVSAEEMKERIKMLAEDPYAIVDFARRPALNSTSQDNKNLKAFYSADYFSDEIRPIAYLKPNEGRYTVIVISNIETMNKTVANAFLKLLEEPPERVMFLLTCDNVDQLLPTVISRCHVLRCPPLSEEEIRNGLITFDGAGEDEAAYLARIAAGNYDSTRYFDPQTLKERRNQIVEYLRYSYIQDAPAINGLIKTWQDTMNNEGLIGLCNLMEMLLRDVLMYQATEAEELITNQDQLEVIKNFASGLRDARLEAMINHVNQMRKLIYQNGNSKIILITLSLRFSALMRGKDPAIPDTQPWLHTPAYQE